MLPFPSQSIQHWSINFFPFLPHPEAPLIYPMPNQALVPGLPLPNLSLHQNLELNGPLTGSNLLRHPRAQAPLPMLTACRDLGPEGLLAMPVGVMAAFYTTLHPTGQKPIWLPGWIISGQLWKEFTGRI